MSGAFAEVVAAPQVMTFPLPDGLDFAQGAALILNFHTAYFALVTRGRLKAGETVLIHGGAGGVGTATIQVAKGLGARTIAVVSTDDKPAVAKAAGADEVVRSDAAWKDEVLAVTGGRGVDIVIDPAGGDRFTDSLRSLNREGRLVVVGFTGGAIPEVKVNRLLLRNTEVVGAGWGEYVISSGLTYGAEVAVEIASLAAAGYINPPVGARFPLERASEAWHCSTTARPPARSSWRCSARLGFPGGDARRAQRDQGHREPEGALLPLPRHEGLVGLPGGVRR